MKRTRRTALVLVGAAALSLTSVVASAGPLGPPAHRIVDSNGDGLLQYGGVEPVTTPAGFSAAGLHSLLSFVQMTDVHVTDEESPGRLEFLDQVPPFGGAYRPNESLSTQTLEAMVERVSGVASPVTQAKPGFTIVTGDMADSQQYNEARWLIDILDGGKTINPDSGLYGTPPAHLYDGVQGGNQFYDPNGTADGPGYSGLRDFPGLFEAAQKSFSAQGLGMPWYATFGNHDALIQGNAPLAYFRAGFPNPNGAPSPVPGGFEAANPSTQAVVIGSDKLVGLPPMPPDYAGTPSDWILDNLNKLLTNPYAYINDPTTGIKATYPELVKTVPADPRRCYLAKDTPVLPAAGIPMAVPCQTTSWVDLLKASDPAGGHGLGVAAANDGALGRPLSARLTHSGYYSFSPAAGFRMIVLDTVTGWCTSHLCDWGTLDGTQFDWLKAQLTAAAGDDEKVIVFSHHPLVGSDDVITPGPSQDPTEPMWKSSADVQAELCKYPAVLATVSGHTHRNHVDPISCPSDSASSGFVAINTTSEMDYPAQARMIEVVQNAKGQIGIATSMIDNASPPQVGSNAVVTVRWHWRRSPARSATGRTARPTASRRPAHAVTATCSSNCTGEDAAGRL